MSYGADFATADPANAPLDPVLMIGADPFVWGAILLALAAALLAGYYFGSRSNGHRSDAAHAIWEAIHDAARSAMVADDNALRGRAEHLLKVLDARLGNTQRLVGGISEAVAKLRAGVQGRAPAGGHGHGHHEHGPGYGHGHGHGGAHGASDHGHGHDEGPAAHPAPAAAPAVTIVNVNAGSGPGHPPGDHPPAHPPHEPRDLTQRQQTELLRLAVAAFNQHWRDESARVGELRAAHAELGNPGPARPARPAARPHLSASRARH